MPPIAAAKINIPKEEATEFIDHAMPQSTPPITTIHFGPKRSTRYPSAGTSQVSSRTKMVNVTWMAALPQWYLSPIGPTNSVQPYCRLAIITMQMMPMINCAQGRAKTEVVWEFESVTIDDPPPSTKLKKSSTDW